jgi:hypothetical protein
MRHEINSDFWLGDIVYLRTATDEKPGMITGVYVTPGGLKYIVTSDRHDTYHYAMELSTEYVPHDWPVARPGKEPV